MKAIKKQPRRSVNFHFPEDLLKDLKEVSSRTGETVSTIVREGARREVQRRLESSPKPR